MSIANNIARIKKNIPERVKLVAVSKFHSNEAILEAYNTGQRIFGESKMQELSEKQKSLPSDIEWHFIGHLQTNKVKTIIPYTNTIHSVDSWKLFSEIEKQSALINKPVNCLLEIHIGDEESKFGFSIENCRQFLVQHDWKSCRFVNIVGLMGMATDTNDETRIRKEFKQLRIFFEELKCNYFSDTNTFAHISMGMSHDFKIAIEEGSTIVRIGSSIFGQRS